MVDLLHQSFDTQYLLSGATVIFNMHNVFGILDSNGFERFVFAALYILTEAGKLRHRREAANLVSQPGCLVQY